MDAALAIASRREVREYSDQPVPEAAIRRILDAGRLAGSGRNMQRWRFIVVRDRALLDVLAETVSRKTNVQSSGLLIVIVVFGEGARDFDAGRAAQNMMLAAWNEGIGSVPNGFVDKERARELLQVPDECELLIGLTFGYPAKRGRDPESRTAEEWAARADRLPLDELVLQWR